MNRKFKITEFFYIFYNINVFTVTFDQFNASLLNKSINFSQKKKSTDPKLWMVLYIKSNFRCKFKNFEHVCSGLSLMRGSLVFSLLSSLICSSSALPRPIRRQTRASAPFPSSQQHSWTGFAPATVVLTMRGSQQVGVRFRKAACQL